jgi:very-short-patch-repair endonuclease
MRVVVDSGGRATRAQILAACTRHQLAASLRTGRLVRLRRDVYGLPGLLDPLVVAARVGGVLSHASAALFLGLSLVDAPTETHVTIPHGHKPTLLPGVRVHRARSLPPDDVIDGYTSPIRTVLDCAATMPFGHALAIADSALATSYVTERDLRERAASSALRGRGRRRRVAEAADRRADNAFESALRALVLEAGVTTVEPQVRIRLPRRTVVVDLADRARRLVIEGDSYTHHGTRSAFRADCDRYNDLIAAGWMVLRFTWEHVVLRPERVLRVVVETIGRIDGRVL